MLDDFAEYPAITPTNDQDLLWVWVRIHGQVCNHFLVCELIPLGTLNDIVEDKHSAIVGGLEDEDVLIFALLVVDDIFDFEGHSLARPHLRDLTEPSICCIALSVGQLK